MTRRDLVAAFLAVFVFVGGVQSVICLFTKKKSIFCPLIVLQQKGRKIL